MRDFGALRRRLLVAMGLVGVAQAGCGTAATSPDAGAVSDGATSDAVGADAASDVGADAGGDTATDATGDGVASDADAAVADVAVDVATDVGASDSADSVDGVDAVDAVDAPTLDVETGDATDAAADGLSLAVCPQGGGVQECMTAAQLAWAVDNKWGGGDQADAGGSDAGPPKPDYPVPPEGCPVKERVFDGCCNPAQDGPLMVGDTCCYVFCAGACCGRPLVVDGGALVAAVGAGPGWAPNDASPSAAADITAAAALAPPTRAALAAIWAADAAMEHASIASFHRFSLDLLRFGAPADLVADAARAALDEVDHAERCFTLASLVAGEPIGPQALPLPAHLQLATDLGAAVEAAVAEGCVGETLAAGLVAEAARSAQVPAVREALAIIASDEARHAELAWRFVRWALLREPALRGRAAAAFSAALRRLPEPAALGVADDLGLAWGRLPPRRFRAVVTALRREVLVPCAAALCGDFFVDAGDVAPTVARG